MDIPGKHTIHIDEDEEGREVLNPYFEVIKIAMRDFFSEHMLPHPVQIEKRTYSNTYYVDSQDVKSIYWSVTGGAILNQDFNKVDVLLFSDADSHSLTVSGEYKSGLTFYKSLDL